jgi:hypothetical protein
MQSWQIKALELECSALKRLDGFISEHGLIIITGIICLLVLLCIWVLASGLRRRLRGSACGVTPVIIIQTPIPRRDERYEFDPYPPPRDWWECNCCEE